MGLLAKLVWLINLKPLRGRRVRIETFDGHYREGVVMGIEMSTVMVLGKPFDYPSAIRFELDDADGIPWTSIKTLELARSGKKNPQAIS
jgi:hypothetical protein